MPGRWLLGAVVTCALGQGYGPPSGERPAHRGQSASILPGGRVIAPAGRQYATGSGPFGMALSPSGKAAVTANLGPGTPSLTVLERGKDWGVRQLPAAPPSHAAENAWQSVSFGLAFADEHSVFVAEGNTGRVALVDLSTGERRRAIDLNQNGFRDSFSGDLVLDSGRKVLYVADQANFRIAVADIRSRQIVGSIPVGRLPFAITLSPDRRKLYVANTGTFRYEAVPGADLERAAETGLRFPAFGFPGVEAAEGATRETGRGAVLVPGLGDPDARESNSVFVVDVSETRAPKIDAVDIERS